MADLTYTYTPKSGLARDKLRLLIPDRVVKTLNPQARFSDQELDDLLDASMSGGELVEAAAMACEIIAMDETKRQMSVSINSGMSISRSNQPSFWLQRAKSLRENALKAPWEIVDSVAYDIDGLAHDHSDYVGDEDDL